MRRFGGGGVTISERSHAPNTHTHTHAVTSITIWEELQIERQRAAVRNYAPIKQHPAMTPRAFRWTQMRSCFYGTHTSTRARTALFHTHTHTHKHTHTAASGFNQAVIAQYFAPPTPGTQTRTKQPKKNKQKKHTIDSRLFGVCLILFAFCS